MQHTFDADVLIDLRPMDTDAIADQLPMVALNGSGFGQPPRPRKRHTHGTAVDEIGGDLGLGDTQVGNSGFNDGFHNAHVRGSWFVVRGAWLGEAALPPDLLYQIRFTPYFANKGSEVM